MLGLFLTIFGYFGVILGPWGAHQTTLSYSLPKVRSALYRARRLGPRLKNQCLERERSQEAPGTRRPHEEPGGVRRTLAPPGSKAIQMSKNSTGMFLGRGGSHPLPRNIVRPITLKAGIFFQPGIVPDNNTNTHTHTLVLEQPSVVNPLREFQGAKGGAGRKAGRSRMR